MLDDPLHNCNRCRQARVVLGSVAYCSNSCSRGGTRGYLTTLVTDTLHKISQVAADVELEQVTHEQDAVGHLSRYGGRC